MDLGFPLASSLLSGDPFFRSTFADPFTSTAFGEWPVGTTMRRPLLGGGRAVRGAGAYGGIACDMYEKEGNYEYRFDLAGCGKSSSCSVEP